MANAKILIVEDEAIVAKDIEYTLQELGYKTRTITARFHTVMSKVRQFLPDLILMDIVLKGKINGISLARRIRKKFEIPIVYLTAYGDYETVERAKMTGPFGYILKPFEKNNLRTTIELALYKYRIEQELRRALKELTRARKRAQKLAEKVIELQEKERFYLASVIHDELLQGLVAYLYFLQRLKKSKLDDKLERQRLELIQTIRSGISRARSLINEIQPVREPELGLLSMIRQSVDIRFANLDIKTRFIHPPQLPKLGSAVKSNILRIVQEALMNITKHAQARNVVVKISVTKKKMVLMVEDDGVGFDMSHLEKMRKDHFGLFIMEERARLVRGRLKIISRPGKGTRVECSLPLNS